MENENIPGRDGIPYEFYKKFWSLLWTDLYQAMMHNLNNNKALSVFPENQYSCTRDKNLHKNFPGVYRLQGIIKGLGKSCENKTSFTLESGTNMFCTREDNIPKLIFDTGRNQLLQPKTSKFNSIQSFLIIKSCT